MTRRAAVVVGATAGIGRATVDALARRDFAIVANGRRRDRLDAMQSEMTAAGLAVAVHAGDATQASAVAEAIDLCRARFDVAPSAFVLCAGRGLPGTLLRSDDATWRELVEVNYVAVMRQLRVCAQHLIGVAAQAPGPLDSAKDIVVIGSTVGRQVSALNPIYGSTKFAVHAVTEALRQEVCDRGIRVTLIEPGFVRTEFQETAGYEMPWFDALERETGPFLRASDVAEAIAFAVTLPAGVHVDDIRIRATRQKV